ncbi:MAG: glycosyltransferase family 9 protein [Candidatus Margulisiibacteriota bacterium]
MKILIIKLASLGDVLHATPLVRSLASSHEVYFLTFKGHEKLLMNNPHLKRVFTLHQMDSWMVLPWRLVLNALVILRLCFARIDISINLHKKYILNKLMKGIGIKNRFGLLKEGDDSSEAGLSDGIVFNQKEHHILQHLKFAELCKTAPRGTAMEYVPCQRKMILPVQAPYMVLCAGGGKNKWASMSNKVWPKENFVELIRMLGETVQVVLIGGSQDLALHQESIRTLSPRTVHDFTNQLDFDELFYLIKGSKLYLGNDSFLLHFASTTNVSTLGLFGPTKGTLLSPLGARDYFIQSSADCSPCYDANQALQSSSYSCADNQCMKQLSVKTVYEKVGSILTIPEG